MRDKYYYICMETCMTIVLDDYSIQRVIDPTWIRFLFFVNEQSCDAIFTFKGNEAEVSSRRFAEIRHYTHRDRLQKQ